MVDAFLVANAKSDPSGVRNEVMLFSQICRQKCISNRRWERNIDGTALVDVSKFSAAEAKFAATESVRIDGDVRPS